MGNKIQTSLRSESENYVTERRLGKFTLEIERLRRDAQLVAAMLGSMKFIPVRAEHYFHLDAIEYIGYSPLFEKCSTSAIAPEYRITLHDDDEGNLEIVKVEKIEHRT